MICTMDKLKTVPKTAEEREEEEEEGSFVSESEDETSHGDEEPGGRAETEEEQETALQAEGQTEDSFHSRDKASVNNQEIKDPVKKVVGFNLNNEVVKMRKEVKRVRALIIRKLTRRIAALKKKKGKEADIKRNQGRANRLLEEIQAMKVLPPDLVTKTALQKSLDLNQVCKNPNSTISDRGLTRIATHPQFRQRIDGIKDALKAFKEGRVKNEVQEGTEKRPNKKEKFPPAKDRQNMKKKQEITAEQVEITLKELRKAAEEDSKEEGRKENHSSDRADDTKTETLEKKNTVSVEDKTMNNIPGPMAQKKPSRGTESTALQQETDEDESDVESLDDGEKEYFDDSTEERFHRQSSESEESDDDDFFVGKVSKLKKKTKNGDRKKEVKVSPSKQDQRDAPVDESKPKAKAAQLQTVFCSTLSESTGRGRGKPGDRETAKTGRQWKSNGNKQSMSQQQGRGRGRDSGSKWGGGHQDSRPTGSRAQAQGRGGVTRMNMSRDGAGKQALHPSWEASKKRKEQQGQILAFQGKKIKFDDDD